MATKTQTLEDFVENYIQNKINSNAEKTYAGWVIANGVNSDKILSDDVRKLTLDYRKDNGDYGILAEKLHGMGLSSSGYSNYLNEKAYSDMKSGIADAKKQFAQNEQENLVRYADYTDAQKKKFTGIVNSIENAGMIDFDSAYEYAVNSGLSENDAKMAAKTANDIVRKRLKDSIMKTVISKNLTKQQTLQYALSLGLNKDDAAELSYYADYINGYFNSSDYEGGYLDYLKNKN